MNDASYITVFFSFFWFHCSVGLFLFAIQYRRSNLSYCSSAWIHCLIKILLTFWPSSTSRMSSRQIYGALQSYSSVPGIIIYRHREYGFERSVSYCRRTDIRRSVFSSWRRQSCRIRHRHARDTNPSLSTDDLWGSSQRHGRWGNLQEDMIIIKIIIIMIMMIMMRDERVSGGSKM